MKFVGRYGDGMEVWEISGRPYRREPNGKWVVEIGGDWRASVLGMDLEAFRVRRHKRSESQNPGAIWNMKFIRRDESGTEVWDIEGQAYRRSADGGWKVEIDGLIRPSMISEKLEAYRTDELIKSGALRSREGSEPGEPATG
jgi:hypothetical protein